MQYAAKHGSAVLKKNAKKKMKKAARMPLVIIL